MQNDITPMKKFVNIYCFWGRNPIILMSFRFLNFTRNCSHFFQYVRKYLMELLVLDLEYSVGIILIHYSAVEE